MFHFIADTMDVTECHFSFENRFLCTYWTFDKSFTILDVEKIATGGIYRQVSEKEVLGKFRGQWWTGQILFTAGKLVLTLLLGPDFLIKKLSCSLKFSSCQRN